MVVEAAASSKLKNKIMLLVSWFLRSGRINACVVTSCSRERGTFNAMRNESGLKACGAHGKAWLEKKNSLERMCFPVFIFPIEIKGVLV